MGRRFDGVPRHRHMEPVRQPARGRVDRRLIFKIVFIRITVIAAISVLAKAKWLPTLGGVAQGHLHRVLPLHHDHLCRPARRSATSPPRTSAPASAVSRACAAPALLLPLGSEASNSASDEMKNPKKDIPVAIARSGIISALCYLLPVLAMLLVLPTETITGIGGLLDAVQTVFTVYGPAADIMVVLAALMFVIILASQGAAWMIMSDRMQALTAADGAFFGGFFGKISRTLGTPVNVNLLSASSPRSSSSQPCSSAATPVHYSGSSSSISISTFLLSYLLIIPAAIKLRWKHPDIERPFRVPVGNVGFTILGGIALPDPFRACRDLPRHARSALRAGVQLPRRMGRRSGTVHGPHSWHPRRPRRAGPDRIRPRTPDLASSTVPPRPILRICSTTLTPL